MSTTHPFEGRLLPDERLLWFGSPRQGLLLTPRDALLIPFSLLWGGFAIFWEWTVLNTRAPGAMALFGIPFVLIGLFMIAGRFPFDAWLRSRTTYGLTDRRVLMLRASPWPSFTAISLDRLPDASLVEGPAGRGTIRFGPAASLFNRTGNGSFSLWVAALDPTPQFLLVEDARRVFDRVQQLVAGGRR